MLQESTGTVCGSKRAVEREKGVEKRGEKGVEKSADGLHGQWVRYCLKVGSLGSVSGLCLVLCPCAAHTKFCVCCPVCEVR